MDEAAEVADILNEVCAAAVATLTAGSPEARAMLAHELYALAAELAEAPAVADFVSVVGDWLAGQVPDEAVRNRLEPPFRRALDAMIAQLETQPDPVFLGDDEERALEVLTDALAQLTAATVAALKTGDERVRHQLAAHLLTFGGRLPEYYRRIAGPLLNNLRSLLGGAEFLSLPPPEGAMGQLWISAGHLLTTTDLAHEARAGLLDRLVHNTLFAIRAEQESLIEALRRALIGLQRQAASTGERPLAAFLVSLVNLLEGRDPLPPAVDAPAEYHKAWSTIRQSLDRK